MLEAYPRDLLLDGGRLYLAQEHLELVDGLPESQDHRLGAVARRARGLQRALLVETREFRGRAAQARERQRRRQTPAELYDPLLQPLEPATQLVLEILGGHLVEALHLGL